MSNRSVVFIKHHKWMLVITLLLTFYITFVIVCVTILLFFERASNRNGYSLDATDPINFFSLTIKNDRAEPVRVDWVNDCVGLDSEKCAHGWSINSQESVTSEELHGKNRFTVTSHAGRTIGCLDISKEQSLARSGVFLQTSKTSSCN